MTAQDFPIETSSADLRKQQRRDLVQIPPPHQPCVRTFIGFERVLDSEVSELFVEIANGIEERIFGATADPEQFELLIAFGAAIRNVTR